MSRPNKLKVYISVDVEPRICQSISHFPIGKPEGFQALYGLEYVCNTLRKHNALGLFFVETLHHHYFGDELMYHVSPFLQDKHFEIGLHIHPAWTFFKTKQKISDDCANLSFPQLENYIDDGLSQLKKFIPDRSIRFFRSGNLSAGHNLFQALIKKKFQYISTSSMGYSYATKNYHAPYVIDEKLIDIPVTTFQRRFIKNQILSITGVSTLEKKLILNQAYDKNLDFVMIITHPFEFVDNNNKMIKGNCKRLDDLCLFIAKNNDRFEFCHDLSLLKPCQDTILKTPLLSSITTMVSNKINEYY